MKRIYSILFVCLLANGIWGVTPEYYSDLEGQHGEDLIATIGAIAAQGYQGTLTYTPGIWEAYQILDIYPSDSVGKAGKIWDIYSDCTFTPGQQKYGGDQDTGNHEYVCASYNREHSLPKSWFGGSTDAGTPGADIFHIYPTDSKTNEVRSNYPYGECADGEHWGTGKFGYSTFDGYSDLVFEPADEYKGDLARSYFYMVAFWGKENQTQFKTKYGLAHFNNDYTEWGHYGLTQYSVDLLMKWHRMDPVSQKEIDRNNGCQNLLGQGNRNPFIDYPYLAEYLWGTKAGETIDMEGLMGSFENEFVPGVSNGERSIPYYTVTLMMNGTVEELDHQIGTCALPAKEPDICDGYRFAGWSAVPVSNTDQQPEWIYEVNEEDTVYAVYETGSPLMVNDTVVIYYPEGHLALNYVQNSNLAGEAVTIQNDTLIIGEQTAEMIFEQESPIPSEPEIKMYLFRHGTEYLKCPNKGGNLSFGEKDDYAHWYYSNDGDIWKIWNAYATYSGNDQYIEYYSNLFKSYKYQENQSALYSYTIFHRRGGYYIPITPHVYTSEVDCLQPFTVILSRQGNETRIEDLTQTYAVPSVEDEQSACANWEFAGWSANILNTDNGLRPDMVQKISQKEVSGQTITLYAVYRHKAPLPVDGSQVVIFHPASGTALSTEPSFKKLIGIAAEPEGDILHIGEETAEMTWTNHDTVFTLSIGDLYLSGCKETGGITFTSYGDSSLWRIEDIDHQAVIRNPSVTYDGKAQYLEYYKGFTIYGYNTNSTDAYHFNIYQKINDEYHIIGEQYSTMPDCNATSLYDYNGEGHSAKKTLINGQLYITRGGRTYLITGENIKQN